MRYNSDIYLDFIRDGRCSACGGHFPDAHHEAIFTSGGTKRYNDFQALGLCHIECHLEGVHREGKAFWRKRGLDPAELVLTKLREYRDTVSVRRFETQEDYDNEMEVVDDFISQLEERGYE